MPERLLAIDLREIAAGLTEAGALSSLAQESTRADRELSGQWAAADGAALGEPFALGSIESTLVEGFDGRGGIGWQEQPLEIVVPVDPPENAASLGVELNGRLAARVPAAGLSFSAQSLVPPVRETVGPASGRFIVQVIAERFDDPHHFRQCVERARAWALDCPPFDESEIGGELRFDLLFWPTDRFSGQLDTPDSAITDERLFHGNRTLAYQLLTPHLNPKFPSIILINSTRRGGAGGAGAYSAWASIGSDDWEAVCLHELGHGLGLADEYLDDKRANQAWAGEPNVSLRSQAGLAPWRAVITVPPESSPSHDLNPQGQDSRNAVGTFAGCRYRRDYYRPMRDCLMRSTVGGHPFCVACADTIRRAIRQT